MVTETRSRDGCWTCRFRKKKCDERRPSCDTCTTLNLECFRDGGKPNWMDGGPLEKAQLRRMKMTVALSTKKRRQLSRSNSSHQDGELRLPPTPLSPLSTLHPDTLQSSPILQTSSIFDGVYGNDEDYFGAPIPAFPSSLRTPPMSVQSSRSSFADFTQSPLQCFNHCDQGITTQGSMSKDASCVDSLALSKSIPNSSPTTFSTASYQDTALLLHYLDHVYQWQFNIKVLDAHALDKAWVLCSIYESPAISSAMLSLSAMFSGISRSEQPSNIEDFATRAALAPEEFQRTLRYERPISGDLYDGSNDLKNLLCITIYLSISRLQGKYDDWRMHLKTATSVLAAQQTRLKDDSHAQIHGLFDALPCEQTPRHYLTGSILWWDTLSHYSLDHQPQLCDYYLQLLSSDKPRIQLASLTGCQNWVIICLLKIYKLRDWKQSAQAQGALSVRALVEKGGAIKKELEEGSKQINGQTPFHTHMVTSVLLCAINIFLEVVMSGPCPGLSEIREEVSQAEKLLACLYEDGLLRNLIWPICVIGCMAEPGRYVFFRRLSSSSKNVHDKLTFFNLLQVLETCWKLREMKPSCGVDWKMATEELGSDIILA